MSAYLATLGENIHGDKLENIANDKTSVIIDYQQTDIALSYQQWRIIDQSVCYNLEQDTSAYSACTEKAKSLFNQICSALTNRRYNADKIANYKSMYCQAAVAYQTQINTISYGASNKMSDQERHCNQLILKALVNTNAETVRARNKACEGIKK